MKPTKFAMVGAGWRAEFYLRIARALPERFRVEGVVVRNPTKAQALQDRWGVAAYPDVESLLEGTAPGFVVTCVSWEANPPLVRELVARHVPILSETPPAPDLERSREALQSWCNSTLTADAFPI